MISRRTTILTVIALGTLLAAFSGFSWLYEVVRAERHPIPHEITGSNVSGEAASIWPGPTGLQKISVMVSLLAAIAALWSLWRDARHQGSPRQKKVEELPGWSAADDEALRHYLNEQMKHHRKAS